MAAGPAAAHPHVFVDARAEIVFDDQGRITAVRHVWRFDDAFSAYASQGFDADGDGVFSIQELQPLAKVNVESLAAYHYFTFVDDHGKQAPFRDPTEYWLQKEDGLLTLFYTLPLATPVSADGAETAIDIYDPEYFVAIGFAPDHPVTLKNAPAGCTVGFERPKDVDPMTATQLALIPADQRQLPENLRAVTRVLANVATVTCPRRSSAAPAAAAPETPGRAVGGPFGVAPPDAAAPPATGVFAVFARWQAAFYERLSGAVKALRTEPLTAALLLAGLSFGYGIFHAAGPGHGKAVISAYLAVSGANLRRALMLSFLSAFVQATVAVAVVGILAAILGLTSIAMASATRWIELASAAMVFALGVFLVWRKIAVPLFALARRTTGAASPFADPALAAAAERGPGLRPVTAPLSAAVAMAASPPRLGYGKLAGRKGVHGGVAPAAALGGGVAQAAAVPGALRAAGSMPRGGGPALRGAATEFVVHRPGSCECGAVHGMVAAELAGGRWRDALAAAVSAGIRPCTGALIVLTFALSQGLFLAGVASAYAMALGTGATVAAIALATVGAKGLLVRLAAATGSSRAADAAAVLEGMAAALVLALGGALLGAALATG